MSSLLDTITSLEDVKKLNDSQLNLLCKEIRTFLIDSVVDTGGHLASNLGIVELSLAILLTFSGENDKIIYDVGHQCYPHKILTGRKKQFASLRQKDGITGFPSPHESSYDCFVTGHGNTSISAAIGIATAKKLKNEDGFVVAIIGDGSFSGGMVYEGMNNICHLDNLIVVLNDNKMSISKNVGAFSTYLNRLRLSKEYSNAKLGATHTIEKIPLIGNTFVEGLRNIKTTMRQALYSDTFFEMMGFQYFGAYDGHDVLELRRMFLNVKKLDTPVFIHAITQKGRGLTEAELNPKAYHSLSPKLVKATPHKEFSTAFGDSLCEFAEINNDIVAITAAMKDGTGLSKFAKRYPNRFFDVGMAEQHAVTFAAGLSKEGIKPVVAIYSTFLQRGYDQLLNDVYLNDADVLFAVDRAGLVPGDGETHQGIYDVNYLTQPQGSTLIAPSTIKELKHWLGRLLLTKGIRSIRYPRGYDSDILSSYLCTGNAYDYIVSKPDSDTAIIGYGVILEEAVKASNQLYEKNYSCDVIKLLQLQPFPENLFNELLRYKKIMMLHDDVVTGGIGERLISSLQSMGYTGKFIDQGIRNTKIPCAKINELRKMLMLDADSIANKLRSCCNDEA